MMALALVLALNLPCSTLAVLSSSQSGGGVCVLLGLHPPLRLRYAAIVRPSCRILCHVSSVSARVCHVATHAWVVSHETACETDWQRRTERRGRMLMPGWHRALGLHLALGLGDNRAFLISGWRFGIARLEGFPCVPCVWRTCRVCQGQGHAYAWYVPWPCAVGVACVSQRAKRSERRSCFGFGGARNSPGCRAGSGRRRGVPLSPDS